MILINVIAGCPGNDWVADGSKCYMFVEEEMTWEEANEVTGTNSASIPPLALEKVCVIDSNAKLPIKWPT